MDERRLYIKQLLRNYKRNDFYPNLYTVNYRLVNDKGEQYRVFNHNEGIEFVIDYIKELEKELDELHDIKKIIQISRRNDYGN